MHARRVQSFIHDGQSKGMDWLWLCVQYSRLHAKDVQNAIDVKGINAICECVFFFLVR